MNCFAWVRSVGSVSRTVGQASWFVELALRAHMGAVSRGNPSLERRSLRRAKRVSVR